MSVYVNYQLRHRSPMELSGEPIPIEPPSVASFPKKRPPSSITKDIDSGTVPNSGLEGTLGGKSVQAPPGSMTNPSYGFRTAFRTATHEPYQTGLGMFMPANATLGFAANGACQIKIASNLMYPGTDNVLDLGATDNAYKDVYVKGQYKSALATGTSPMSVSSTTLNTNFNADLVDGLHASSFALSGHNITSTTHGDAAAATVVRGDILVGNSTPKWDRLPIGTTGKFLKTDGTDPSWASIDHGADLAGLTDDDHTQYALLAGRSGGQTLRGGNAASNNLTLDSTAHATKGSVLIGSDGSDWVLGASSTNRIYSDNASNTFNLVSGVTSSFIIYPSTHQILFPNASGDATSAGLLRRNGANLTWHNGTAAGNIWTSANDGAGSGLDADLLDGLSSTAFVPQTLADAKGDILAASAADTWTRLAVGSNDQVLTADSTQATGLKWATPSAGTQNGVLLFERFS